MKKVWNVIATMESGQRTITTAITKFKAEKNAKDLMATGKYVSVKIEGVMK